MKAKKTKKAMKEYIIKVPVKYLPGDKAWMVDYAYVDDPNSVACDACGHCDGCHSIYVARQVIIEAPIVSDYGPDVYCNEYATEDDNSFDIDELYDTEEAAQKAANKLNKQNKG
jgi:SRSO17 transposase